MQRRHGTMMMLGMQFPVNAFHLAIWATKRLEKQLASLGLASGNGLYEKSCSLRLDLGIRQKMQFIGRTRNALVHGGGESGSKFPREAFIQAFVHVNEYLSELESITREPGFGELYVKECMNGSGSGSGREKSVLEFAQELKANRQRN